jgi:hypothetical protein
MNFYDLNQIIEQSKVSEVVVNRPGFTPTGKPVTPAPKPPVTGAKPPVTGAKPPVTGAKPAVTGAKPAVTGAKPAVTGHPASLENLARAPKRAKIKFGKIPPGCPSFGCRKPEASPQETA